jgi:hypothetical protein
MFPRVCATKSWPVDAPSVAIELDAESAGALGQKLIRAALDKRPLKSIRIVCYRDREGLVHVIRRKR